MAENYYAAGAAEKGADLGNRLMTMYRLRLEYFNKLSASDRSAWNQQIGEALYVTNQLAELFTANAEEDLARQANETLQKYSGLYRAPQQNQ
jgi:hypothetical protein